jgi:uncharacterized protein YbaA (DUF1428 family)
MEMLLENKNALIYGAGGAIGGAVARAFAREGAKVFLAGRILAKLDAVAREISAVEGAAETAQVDALDEQAKGTVMTVTFQLEGQEFDVKDQVPFPRIIESKPDETVVFAWIVFESREHRDEVNAKVMADPRLASMAEKGSMPFDCKRMAYGGFRMIVEA